MLLAVNEGLLDGIAPEDFGRARRLIRKATAEKLPEVCEKIAAGENLEDKDREKLVETARSAVAGMTETQDNAGSAESKTET